MVRENALGAYCRAVKGWLPCDAKQKRRILEKIRLDVTGYLEESPDADIAAIQARFGTPQTIASAYVDDMDTAKLLHSLRVRKRIITIVAAAMAVILLTWAGVVTWAVVDEINSKDAVIVESITITDD